MVAPWYLLGAVLSGTLAGLALYGTVTDPRRSNAIYLLAPVALLFGIGFLFALGRAVSVLVLSDGALRIRNGLGRTQLVLASDATDRTVALVKKSDVLLEGPVVAEDTLATKAAGSAVRLVLSGLHGRAWWLQYALANSTTGGEDFVMVVTGAEGRAASALLPDVYGWNQSAYAALTRWLADHAFVLPEGCILLDDAAVRAKGRLYAILAVIIALLLAGAGVMAVRT